MNVILNAQPMANVLMVFAFASTPLSVKHVPKLTLDQFCYRRDDDIENNNSKMTIKFGGAAAHK
ncbi:UNKNOWN [Stylonychia lemnae]|uniref:Uncharacterized protein n=1 Tax=Stylonychia lemnae TaxID=5949 RepID=A0A078A912_STYLE|nr:UNKNOWN [Stylonychia lemnae]|eukprot:CDW78042.1 UNKNOWN [Stylonychia lemnae]